MALLDSLKGFYTKLEDSYYGILDAAESKGIPVYKVVDAIEAQNMPSFPIAVILSLAVIYLLASTLLVGALSSNVEVLVQDDQGNLVPGATVTAAFQGKIVDKQVTDSSGKTVIRAARNLETEITVEKTGFAKSTSNFLATRQDESKTIVLEKEVTTIRKTINILQAGTSRAFEGAIEVEFSCSGNDYSEKKTVAGGEIELELRSDCDTLSVKTPSGYSVSNDTISLASDEQAQVFVQQGSAEKGGAIVTVTSDEGRTIAGIDATLYTPTEANAAGTAFDTKQTSSNGTAAFSSVPSGRYYIVAYDRSGAYAEYDGLAENSVQEVRSGEITSFAVVLTQSVAGKIKVQVSDKATNDAIEGTTLTLSKGQTEITSAYTDSTGKAEFNVGEDVEYAILIDKAGYLLKQIKAHPSADTQLVSIEQATIENSQSLLVSVVDEREKPIENVRLKLKANEDGTQAGSELVTGLDGRAIFQRIDDGLYYVYALKPGFGEKTSETINVNSRLQNTLKIKLALGNGTIEASAVDEEGKPVAGANIKAVDFGTFQTIDEVSTDSDGKKDVSARADKKVFLIVSAEGYLPTTTVPLQMQRDATVEKTVVLSKSVQGLGVELEGLFIDDERLADSEGALNPGEKYTARLRLLVPRNSAFEEIGAHLRTGKEQNNSLDKDLIYISAVRAAYSALQQGTTYNPPLSQATDLQHLGSGNSKWANVIFRKASGGIYEIEADVQVKDDAKIGSPVELWYRAYGKSGGILRAPNDSVLGTSENGAQKQALYANALKRTFSIGPSSLCGEDFCAGYTFESMSEGISSSVVDNYTAQAGGKYKFRFELSSLSQTPFSSSVLSVRDKTGSISIESYRVRAASGEERTSQRAGTEFSAAVGEIGKDSVVSGEMVFEAKKEGTVPLEVYIVSGTGTQSEVYRKTVYVKILPAKKLGIDVLPKIIVPLINNNVLIRATDGDSANPISNAKISIKKDDEIIASGETDIEGVFAYTLLSPGEGGTIGILAEKAGYAPSEKQIKVSGNILATDPPAIKLSLNAGGGEFKTVHAGILNYSQIPLEVEKVTLGKEFEGYAGIKFEPLEGTVIAPDGNAELNGSVNLGERGKNISQPVRVQGAINVHLTNPLFQQKWIASIPLELSLGFGDEVDSTDCFNAFPSEWKIFGSTTETRKLTVNITNNCKVAGEDVGLKNLAVRIVSTTEGALGTYRATSSLEGSNAVQLEKVFRTVAANVPANSENTVAIEFKPSDVSSASTDAKIELQATHLTSTGEQKITRKVDVKASINNLSECLEILTNRDITVQSCPYNTGFGNYGNRFSQFSNSRYSAYDPYSARYGYGTGAPPYLGSDYPQRNTLGASYYDYQGGPAYQNSYQNSAYPNSYYSQPFSPAEGVNNRFDTAWNCGSGGFSVRNNCSSPVDLSFDAQPGINVKDRTVKVDAGKEAQVTVEPTNFFGRYALNVKAKPTESSQKSTDLATLYVNVVNQLAKNYRDCISVNPSRVIAFNDFVGQPVVLKIENTCYDQGVFLDASNNTISFPGFGIANPADIRGIQQTGIGRAPIGQAFPTVNASDGAREMIESWAFIDEQTEQQANGKVKQTLYFELVKALKKYRTNAPAAEVFTQNNFANIGNLRYFLTSAAFAVEARTTMLVHFSTPEGGGRTTSFPMIIQDYWPLLGFAEQVNRQFNTYGSPTFTSGQCINDKALDFTNLGDLPAERVYSTKDNAGEKGGLFIIDEQKGCGSVDKIAEPFNPIEFASPTGLKMIVEHDGHEAAIRFDQTNWNGARATFNVNALSRVTRVSPPRAELHNFNIKINVRATAAPGTAPGTTPGTTPGATGASFLCKDGAETGDGAFTKYGFQHLSFDWRPPSAIDTKSGMQRNACDAIAPDGITLRKLNVTSDAPQFCDAVQATAAIMQKVSETKKLAEFVKASTNGLGECAPSAGGFECAKEENRTAKELYRYVLSQKAIKEGRFAYFLGKDNKLFDLSSLPATGSPLAGVRETINSLRNASPSSAKDARGAPTPDAVTQNNKIISDTTQVLAKLVGLITDKRLKGAEAVLEVSNLTAADLQGDIVKENGSKIKGPILPFDELDAKWHVVNLGAYTIFREQLQGQIDAGNCPKEICVLPDGRIVTTKFLKALADNGKWKIAVRNAKQISSEVKDALMQDGNWVIGKGEVAGNYDNSFAKFHSQNIEPRMYLIKDEYNDDFYAKFRGDYANDLLGERQVGDTKVKFEAADKLKAESGDYNLLIDYTWAKSEAKVSFTQRATLAQVDSANAAAGFKSAYASNPLLSMPIDGRVEWGTGFAGIDGALMNFNNYITVSGSPTRDNPAANKAGQSTASFTYAANYDDTKAGRIASISPTAIVFSPSDPAKVEATVAKGIATAPAGFLFDFVSSANNFARPYPAGFIWKIVGTGLGLNAGENLQTDVRQVSELCATSTSAPDSKFAGIIVSGAEAGTANLRTVVYSPTDNDKAAQSFLELKCVKDSGTSVRASYESQSLGTAGTKIRDRVVLSRSGEVYRTDYNLKSLLSYVKGGASEGSKVCAKAAGGKLELYWNDAYFLK